MTKYSHLGIYDVEDLVFADMGIGKAMGVLRRRGNRCTYMAIPADSIVRHDTDLYLDLDGDWDQEVRPGYGHILVTTHYENGPKHVLVIDNGNVRHNATALRLLFEETHSERKDMVSSLVKSGDYDPIDTVVFTPMNELVIGDCGIDLDNEETRTAVYDITQNTSFYNFE